MRGTSRLSTLSAPVGLARELPEILAIVEHLGRVHVIGAVELRLDEEEILGVADVLLQIGRHGSERLEQAGENALVGLDQRIAGLADIEVDRAVVGVDHHLDRVAHVVEAAGGLRLGVGKPVAGGVGVLHPEQAAVAHHDIGIVVELQDGRDRAHAVLDVAMKQDPALVGDVAGEQDVGVAVVPGEQAAPGRVADGDAVGAVVGRVDVVLALGIVELRRGALDDDIALARPGRNRGAARG